MSRLMRADWKKFDKFLLKEGCRFIRQRGDHRIYHKDGLIRPLVIPMENPLPAFIIKNNLRLLNIPIEEYFKKVQKI